MMDSGELALVRSSLRHVLTSTPAEALPAALVDQGWYELVAGDAGVVIAALFEEQGATRVAGPALDVVMLDALARAGGSRIDPASSAMILPPLVRQRTVNATVVGHRLIVEGLVVNGFLRATMLVAASSEGVHLIPATSVVMDHTGAFDPALGLATVKGEMAMANAERTASYEAWTEALCAGRRALASELVGVAATMMTMTIEYISARKQYRRPIGSFQSVQHRMADAHIALCAAIDAVTTAHQEQDEWSAVAAKALAGRAALVVAANCFQVHGGIAFTAEHQLHGFIQRANLLDALLGSHTDLAWAMGRQLLDGGGAPRVPRL